MIKNQPNLDNQLSEKAPDKIQKWYGYQGVMPIWQHSHFQQFFSLALRNYLLSLITQKRYLTRQLCFYFMIECIYCQRWVIPGNHPTFGLSHNSLRSANIVQKELQCCGFCEKIWPVSFSFKACNGLCQKILQL